MSQISDREFCDAVIATKKDTKLVAAAKNDRINSPESLYREFVKLSVDRQREIINTISSDHFVGAQWKVAFQLNNLPAAALADGIQAVGKALFFSRDEDCVKAVVRAIRIYQDSPFFKSVVAGLAEAAETVGTDLATVADAITDPEIFGLTRSLDPSSPVSGKIVSSICKMASYTKDSAATIDTAKFLYARRFSASLESVISVLENAVFMARDRKSVKAILAGLGAGAIDSVLQRHAGNKQVIGQIRDIAWKTRNPDAIRNFLEAL